MTDYKVYRFSGKEKILYGTEAVALVVMIAYVFYRSFIAAVLLLPLTFIFFKYKKAELKRKRKYELSMEFREAIMSVNAALTAGYSIENAFVEAGKDMAKLYGEDGLTEGSYCGEYIKELTDNYLFVREENLLMIMKESDYNKVAELIGQ